MNFYMSGTPFDDQWQKQERAICTHRLFSLHGSYRRAVDKWVLRVKEALEVDPNAPYPKAIMLDSGAFTAWNKGHETSVDEVLDAYSSFMEDTVGMFDEIWMINLDKIPGEKGRDPSLAEINEALEVSDRNYKILVDTFGERILPVFHQGEDDARLFEVAEMVKGKSEYICVSPRNDLPERQRHTWSRNVHRILHDQYPECRTHGLATTGNVMIREVPWYSIDSAAWVLHAGYGMIDIFHKDKYRNYFVSYEGGKHERGEQHLDNLPPRLQEEINGVIQGYGFPLEEVQKEFRARSIICMGELNRYAQWAREHQEQKGQLSGQPGLIDLL